jgi:hypothetical protein
MDSRSNRRDSARYQSIENHTWLACRVEGQETQVPARIQDISQSGVSVAIAQQPGLATGEPAWLRLEAPSPTDWVETTVVGITPVFKGGFWNRSAIIGHVVRLRFTAVCPYDFFKAATHGKQLDASFQDNGPTEADRVIWR